MRLEIIPDAEEETADGRVAVREGDLSATGGTERDKQQCQVRTVQPRLRERVALSVTRSQGAPA